MSRFDIDLSEVATSRPTMPAGIYEARIVKGSIAEGESDKGKWARMDLILGISNPEVALAMGQDEPKVFFSGFFSFDESGNFNKMGCPEIGQFLEVTGFSKVPSSEFANDETEQAETSRQYTVALFKSMLDASVGLDLLCKINLKKHKTDDRMINPCTGLCKLEED